MRKLIIPFITLVLLLYIPLQSSAQRLMLGESKRNVRLEMGDYNEYYESSSTEYSIEYTTKGKVLLYHFVRLKTQALSNRYACSYIDLIIFTEDEAGLIKSKEDCDCWIDVGNDVWKYNSNRMPIILIHKIIKENKSIFRFSFN